MNAKGFRHLQRIPKRKSNALKYCLGHIRSGGVHGHPYKSSPCVRIIMRGTLSHQIREKIYMVFAQLLNALLLPGIVFRPDNILHPPLIAGRRAEHTAHQMIVAVRMGERMERIESVHTEFFGGNKNRSAGAQGNIAHSFAHGSGSHRRRRVIPGASRHLNGGRNAKLRRDVLLHRSHTLVALEKLRQHFLADAADIAHFL